MRSLIGLLKKDFKIAYRNYYFLIIIIVAILLILVTDFLIPKELSFGAKIIYAIEDDNNITHNFTNLLEKQAEVKRVEGKDYIIEEMKDDKEAIGLIIGTDKDKITFDIIFQGYESDKSKNTLLLTLESMVNINNNLLNSNIKTVVLKPLKSGDIPYNKRFVPLMILNEPVMLGFVLLATLIFMEKDEDTLRAYLVTPRSMGLYFLSKILLIIALGLISTILITAFTVGIKVNWFMLLTITITGGLLSSTSAMLVSSFFENISKAMIWVLGISIVLTIPMISYFLPSFSPKIVTIIPTYYLMFAIREAIFPMGNDTIFIKALILSIVLSAILFGLSVISYKRSLFKN